MVVLFGQAENRLLTTAFIDVAPVELTLIPRTKVADGQGGEKLTTGTPRSPQRFSLLEPGDSGYRAPTVIAEGKQTSVDFMLLGEWDAVMEENDVFVHEGHEYKLLTIMPENGYERRALVVKHGW